MKILPPSFLNIIFTFDPKYLETLPLFLGSFCLYKSLFGRDVSMSSKLWQGNSVLLHCEVKSATIISPKCILHYMLCGLALLFLPVFPANIICICNKSDGSGARKKTWICNWVNRQFFYRNIFFKYFLPNDEIPFLLAYFLNSNVPYLH